MNRSIAELEENLKAAVSSEALQKRGFVIEFSEIDELNQYKYQELMELRRQGKVVVKLSSHGAQSQLYSLVTSRVKKYLTILLITCGFLLLTIGMILSATVSPWFLVSALLFPICLMYVKRVHMQSTFYQAFRSEIIFCYMFCSGYITVQLPDGNIFYRAPS